MGGNDSDSNDIPFKIVSNFWLYLAVLMNKYWSLYFTVNSNRRGISFLRSPMKNVIKNILSLNVRGLKLLIVAKINRIEVNFPLAVVVKILLQMPLASWQISRWWCKCDRCSTLLRCITDSFCSTFNEKRKFELSVHQMPVFSIFTQDIRQSNYLSFCCMRTRLKQKMSGIINPI